MGRQPILALWRRGPTLWAALRTIKPFATFKADHQYRQIHDLTTNAQLAVFRSLSPIPVLI